MKTCYNILHAQYPNACIKIPDKDYNKPTRAFLWDELVSSYMEDYQYLINATDCDDFALFLHAWIRQRQYREKWRQPLAFGEAWSSKHAFNISILNTNEVVLIEPQNDNILPPDTYDVKFIRM